MKNAQGNTSNEIHSTTQAWVRSPYLLWLIWLVWLPLFIPAAIGLFQSHMALSRLIMALIGATLFFIIYLWGSWWRAHSIAAASSLPKQTGVLTWISIATLTALSFGLTLLAGYGVLGLFYYTSGYVGGSLPVRKTIVATLAIMLIALAGSWITGITWLDLLQGLIFIPAIVLITRTVMWSIVTSWELHDAREEIARLAVTNERLRIARDLHDLLGHNLSLIALKSELARRLIAVSPERAATEIGDVENVARTTLQEVREAVTAYRRPTLASELYGAQEILTAAGITYRFEGDESVINVLSPAIESVLSWTVREGVTNVIRHSRAHQCTIRASQEKQVARVEVIDDGIASTGCLDNNTAGNGLRGLAERVAALGGQCEANPGPGGFHLSVSVPLVQQAKQDAGMLKASPLQHQPLASIERVNDSSERTEPS